MVFKTYQKGKLILKKSILDTNVIPINNAPIRKASAIAGMIRTKFENGEIEIPVSTGYKSIDKFYKGIKKGQIIILGGRSSMGKTTVALNMVYRLLNAGKKVLFVDTEEQQEENIIRLFTIQKQFAFKDYLEADNLTENQKKEACLKLKECEKWLDSKELYYVNKPNLTLKDINEIAKDYKDLDLVIIDHLTKIKSDVHGSRYEKVTDVASNLRWLSAELGGVPLMLLAQINREAVKGQGKKVKPPTIADIKGSGEIEENADVVMLLHRDSYYNQEADTPLYCQAKEEPMMLIIGKARGSKTGCTSLKWIPDLYTVSDYGEAIHGHSA